MFFFSYRNIRISSWGFPHEKSTKKALFSFGWLFFFLNTRGTRIYIRARKEKSGCVLNLDTHATKPRRLDDKTFRRDDGERTNRRRRERQVTSETTLGFEVVKKKEKKKL